MSSLFPIFADLNDRDVLIVGGGEVARRKAQALLEAGARLRIVARKLEPALLALADSGRVEHVAGDFEARWLDGAWLAIAATDDDAVNRAVADAGAAQRIFVNIVDDAARSSFHVPARIERGPLQIAISSGGHAPMLARHLRERLEIQLDESWGGLALLFARFRQRIRRRLPNLARRRRFFSRAIDGEIAANLRRGDAIAAERALKRLLAQDEAIPVAGNVALVGAGPGDPGLLTLHALRRLNEADVILHDRLVSQEVLALARRDAERIEVGKESGRHHTTQDGIHALMLEHARAGKRVVRLKGGDPFIFGRGGEELEFLRDHRIAYEVVPGISAALACAAYAGLPLTHRDHAQSMQFVTAHAKDDTTPDWNGLARARQTLAVYMGVANLGEWRDRLVEHGRDPATPFALIENGSRADQRVIVGPLAELAERAVAHAVRSPALLILGETAALAERLHWFGSPPLGAAPSLSAFAEAA